jgi:hypothetical protein
MSSILKALKKLEEEKSLHEEQKEINISREILKPAAVNRNLSRWLWLLGSSAALVIMLLTFALIRKPASKDVVKPPELPLASQPAPPLSGQNRPASPAVNVNDTKTSPVEPPAASSPLPRQLPAAQKQGSAAVFPIISEKTELPGILLPAPELQMKESAVKALPLPASVNSEPSLTLSGIAWNKDSHERLAIINGQPAATGETVSGTLVEEILQDRVKLSRNGKAFELLIGKTATKD